MHDDLFTFILDHLAAHLINVDDRVVHIPTKAILILSRAILRLHASTSSRSLLHYLLFGLLLLEHLLLVQVVRLGGPLEGILGDSRPVRLEALLIAHRLVERRGAKLVEARSLCWDHTVRLRTLIEVRVLSRIRVEGRSQRALLVLRILLDQW